MNYQYCVVYCVVVGSRTTGQRAARRHVPRARLPVVREGAAERLRYKRNDFDFVHRLIELLLFFVVVSATGEEVFFFFFAHFVLRSMSHQLRIVIRRLQRM